MGQKLWVRVEIPASHLELFDKARHRELLLLPLNLTVSMSPKKTKVPETRVSETLPKVSEKKSLRNSPVQSLRDRVSETKKHTV